MTLTEGEFRHWLLGFLEDKLTLDTGDITLIKEQASQVIPNGIKPSSMITYEFTSEGELIPKYRS